MVKKYRIGFIGFGLIGGSIARALKESGRGYNLMAYDHHRDRPDHIDKQWKYEGANKSDNKTLSSSNELEAALSDGVLDAITPSLEEDFAACDIIFLCAPVLANMEYLPLLKSIVKPDCIITDVGSVKGNIYGIAKELGLDRQFIGGHPMTGSEKTGYHNSYSMLLENAYYILTPTEDTQSGMLKIMIELVKVMGSIPILLDPDEHDRITAAISHVPHIIAAQLVNLVRKADTEEETMKVKALAAGGFKDITRIASSSPTMWQNICLSNGRSIKHLLDQYIASLQDVSSALAESNQDYLYRIFDTAGEYRSSIPNKAIGMMTKIYEIYLDIADETGAIATIAVLLADNQISIRNIGIIHNREFEEGVLRIEFYDEEGMSKAARLLKDNSYSIYNR